MTFLQELGNLLKTRQIKSNVQREDRDKDHKTSQALKLDPCLWVD